MSARTLSYPQPPTAADDLPELVRPAIEKYRDEADASSRIPAELLDHLRAAGVFRLYTPGELGGYATPLAAGLSILERLGRIDGPVAWIVWNLNLGYCAALLGQSAVSRIWANGPDPLIVNCGQPGRLVLGPDGFRLSGRWSIVSGADVAEWLMLGATVQDGARTDPRSQYYLCCLPRSQVTVLDTWNVVGMRGTNSNTVIADDVPVPPEMSLTVATVSRIDHPLYRIPFTSLGLAGGAAVLIGMARSAVDEAALLAHAKLTAAGTPVAEQPRLQAAVGRATAQVEAARLLLLATAGRLDSTAAARRPITDALRGALRGAMCHAAETTRQVLTAMYEVGGSSPLYATSRLGRIFRDGHAAAQHVDLSAAGYELAGRTALEFPTGALAF
jgi:indole-3-acetate monooxygenase